MSKDNCNINDDLVSVIMPCYNSRFIAESIDSVLKQTYSNLELLITDDHSSDQEVVSLLEEYSKEDDRVRVFFLAENKGPGFARNNCIKEARGRYIAFCDSDDIWSPDKLQKQIAFMKSRSCCLSYGSYFVCDEINRQKGIVVAPPVISLRGLKHDNKIGCLTAVYDSSMYGKFYMPELKKRQDWALFLTILKKCGKAYGIDEPLASYRKTRSGISHNKFGLVKYNAKVYQDVFGYSKAKSYLYLCFVFMPAYATKRVANCISRFIYSK
ncbi:MAG: glycosyltransferase family 2 protein [Bacteroidales bacterium]|nr:glycosyltransferase family 2 protein [Candidatus Cacconaster merdequi]